MKPAPPPVCHVTPNPQEILRLYPPNKSPGYSLLRGKGKVLSVLTTLTKGSKLASQMTEVTDSGSPLRWCPQDTPACLPKMLNGTQSEETIRKLQIVGHSKGQLPWTLPNVNVMKNKKGEGCYYRAGSANIFCKGPQSKYFTFVSHTNPPLLPQTIFKIMWLWLSTVLVSIPYFDFFNCPPNALFTFYLFIF